MTRILWITNVGSHMWNMQHENSDIDLFEVRAEPIKDILTGTADFKSIPREISDYDKEYDIVSHEIGKVIDMLIKGNVNFYWGVMSPIIVDDSKVLQDIKAVVNKNLSKNIFYSINGLAQKNYKKYIAPVVNSKFDEKILKKLKIIIRTLRFGIYFFENHKFNFQPVKDDVTADTYVDAIKDLRIAYANCSLPERIDGTQYRELLYNIRIVE